MPDRLIELAIEALEKRKADIEAEIAALRKGLRPAHGRRRVRARSVGKKSRISTAGRKALSERMTARWAEWRTEHAKTTAKVRKPTGRAKTKRKRAAKSAEEKKS